LQALFKLPFYFEFFVFFARMKVLVPFYCKEYIDTLKIIREFVLDCQNIENKIDKVQFLDPEEF